MVQSIQCMFMEMNSPLDVADPWHSDTRMSGTGNRWAARDDNPGNGSAVSRQEHNRSMTDLGCGPMRTFFTIPPLTQMMVGVAMTLNLRAVSISRETSMGNTPSRCFLRIRMISGVME